MIEDKRVLLTVGSHRAVKRFKEAFPDATFYGRIGNSVSTYPIPLEQYEERLEELKGMQITKSKDQPFLK